MSRRPTSTSAELAADDFPTRTDWVAADLRRRLGDGEWEPGQRLPTEHVLVDHYGVSRATIRSAIQTLENRGQVYTRRGSGTYALAPHPGLSADLRSLDSMRDIIAHHGLSPSTDYHQVEIRPATADEIARLDLASPGDADGSDEPTVLATARSIRADGELVAYSFESIPTTLLGDGFDPADIGDSLFDLLDQHGALPVVSQTEIRASTADDRFAEHVPEGTLFLRVDQIHRDRSGRAVTLSSSYYLEGRFNFVLTRTR